MKYLILTAALGWLTALSAPRLQAQGAGIPDPSFGSDGLVGVDAFLDEEENAVFATTLPDGRMVVGGNCSRSATGLDFLLARLSSNGSLDPTFGTGGSVSVAFEDDVDAADICTGGARLADGRFLLVGNTPASASSTSSNAVAVVRFLENGNVDAGFGIQGKVKYALQQGTLFAKAVAVQSDGKVVVVGKYNDQDFFALRFLSNGTVDNAFGTNGLVHFGGSGADEAQAVLVQPDGKILVVGYVGIAGNNSAMAVARLLPNGTLDNTFGGDGLVSFEIGVTSLALRLCLSPQGKIGVAGHHRTTAGVQQAVVLRLLSNGSLDDTFGSNGTVVLPLGDKQDFTGGIWAQADGKLVVTGSSVLGANDARFVAARLLTNGQLDPTFGTGGKTTRSVGAPALAYFGVPGPNNTILAAGYARQGGQQNTALVRWQAGAISAAQEPSPLGQRVVVMPNPIVQAFDFHYFVKEEAAVSLHLYDLTGRLVYTFFSEENRPTGEYLQHFEWPAQVPGGNYVLTLAAGQEVVSTQVASFE